MRDKTTTEVQPNWPFLGSKAAFLAVALVAPHFTTACETELDDVGRVEARITANRCPDASAIIGSCPDMPRQRLDFKPWCEDNRALPINSKMFATMTVERTIGTPDGGARKRTGRVHWRVDCHKNQCKLLSFDLENVDNGLPATMIDLWNYSPSVVSRNGGTYVLEIGTQPEQRTRLIVDFDACTLSYTSRIGSMKAHGTARVE